MMKSCDRRKPNEHGESRMYVLLNDVTSDTVNLDTAMSELERKRLIEAAKEIVVRYPDGRPVSKKDDRAEVKTKRQKMHWSLLRKSAAGIACALLLAFGIVAVSPADSPVYAAKAGAVYRISQFMGLSDNLEQYASISGTCVTDNGYTVQLNEVLLDRNTLLVSTSVYRENENSRIDEEVQMAIPVGDVYINGRSAAHGSGGSARLSEDGKMLGALTEFHLDDCFDTAKELDIRLVYHNISLQEGSPAGKWEFHFVADGAALAADTQMIPLDYKLVLENGSSVELSRYTGNVIGQRIDYAMYGPTDCDVKLEGVDDKGRKIVFISHVYEANMIGTKGKGYLQNDSILGSNITEETLWLELTPYLGRAEADETGRLITKYEQTGEPLRIMLHEES